MLVESTEATRDLGGTEGATKAVKKTPDFEPSREAGLSHIVFVGAGERETRGNGALRFTYTFAVVYRKFTPAGIIFSIHGPQSHVSLIPSSTDIVCK